MEITKKDWEDVLKQAENFLHESLLSAEVHKSTIELAKREIKKFE